MVECQVVERRALITPLGMYDGLHSAHEYYGHLEHGELIERAQQIRP